MGINTEQTTGHDHDVAHGSSPVDSPGYEPIAIIGCGMRLPGGVDNDEALWKLLIEKREGRCKVPRDRYNSTSQIALIEQV